MILAAIDVDPQNGFTPLCPDELPINDGQNIVEALNQQAQLAQYRILTKDAHPPKALWLVSDSQPFLSSLPYPNADLAWPMHCQVGTFGFQHLAGLPSITDYDFVVWKGIEADLHPYGACYHDLQETLSTGLIEWLKARKVTDVLLGGLATDHCVKRTALQLQAQGFAVWVNLDACRGLSEESIELACDEMRADGVSVLENLNEFPNR